MARKTQAQDQRQETLRAAPGRGRVEEDIGGGREQHRQVSRQKAGKRGGKAGSYDDWKVADLRRRAKQVGITGRSAMTKNQLIQALRAS